MPETKKPKPETAPDETQEWAEDELEIETAPKAAATQTRYKVLSGGLTGAGGTAYYKGDELTADEIGDQARIDKLLERKAIEIIHD